MLSPCLGIVLCGFDGRRRLRSEEQVATLAPPIAAGLFSCAGLENPRVVGLQRGWVTVCFRRSGRRGCPARCNRCCGSALNRRVCRLAPVDRCDSKLSPVANWRGFFGDPPVQRCSGLSVSGGSWLASSRKPRRDSVEPAGAKFCQTWPIFSRPLSAFSKMRGPDVGKSGCCDRRAG
jgi:hypothetical protein